MSRNGIGWLAGFSVGGILSCTRKSSANFAPESLPRWENKHKSDCASLSAPFYASGCVCMYAILSGGSSSDKEVNGQNSSNQRQEHDVMYIFRCPPLMGQTRGFVEMKSE